MEQVREVLRAWMDGAGLRVVAQRAGVDRKTARRYVEAAEEVGVARTGGVGQLSDEVIGQVLGLVRPVRPDGHGAAWETLRIEGFEEIAPELILLRVRHATGAPDETQIAVDELEAALTQCPVA